MRFDSSVALWEYHLVKKVKKRISKRKPVLKSRFKFIDPFYFSTKWYKLRAIVLHRDRNVCQYCSGYGMQADHIIPRGRGGNDTIDNLVCCCPRCNKLAGGRVFKSFYNKRKWIRKMLRLT